MQSSKKTNLSVFYFLGALLFAMGTFGLTFGNTEALGKEKSSESSGPAARGEGSGRLKLPEEKSSGDVGCSTVIESDVPGVTLPASMPKIMRKVICTITSVVAAATPTPGRLNRLRTKDDVMP